MSEADLKALAPNLFAEASSAWLRARVWLAFVAVLVVVAFVTWAAWPAKPKPEVATPAPAVRQADGSLEAERVAPPAKPTPPPHALPKGAVEVRRGEIALTPLASASSVHVDYSLARMPDGGRRVIVSSPDAHVDQATDMVIEPELVAAPEKPWAAGVSYDTRHATGVWLDRDIGGRLRVGAAVQRLRDGKTEAQLRVGVRW